MAKSWAEREGPILAAIAEMDEARDIRNPDLVVATGLDPQDVARGVRNLYQADYIAGLQVFNQEEGESLARIALRERGYRATGRWPRDPYDEFLRILGEAIALESDPVKRTKLQELLGSIAGVGREVAATLITDALRRAAGI